MWAHYMPQLKSRLVPYLFLCCIFKPKRKQWKNLEMNPFISSKHLKKTIIYFSLSHFGITNLLRKGLGLGLSQPRSALTFTADSEYQARIIAH